MLGIEFCCSDTFRRSSTFRRRPVVPQFVNVYSVKAHGCWWKSCVSFHQGYRVPKILCWHSEEVREIESFGWKRYSGRSWAKNLFHVFRAQIRSQVELCEQHEEGQLTPAEKIDDALDDEGNTLFPQQFRNKRGRWVERSGKQWRIFYVSKLRLLEQQT